MKNKKSIASILQGADENTTEQIAQISPLADAETKDRIYAMTQQRLAKSDSVPDDNAELFSVIVARRPIWMHTAAVAACLLVAVGITGGAVMMHRSATHSQNPKLEFNETSSFEQNNLLATETESVTVKKSADEWTKEELYNLLLKYDALFTEYAVLTGSYETIEQNGHQRNGTYQADFTRDWYYYDELYSRYLSDGTWEEDFQNNHSYYADGFLLKLYDYAPHAPENNSFTIELGSDGGIISISAVQSMLAEVMSDSENWEITGTETMQNVVGSNAYDRECVVIEGAWVYDNELIQKSDLANWTTYTASIDTETGMCMQFSAFDESDEQCFSIRNFNVMFSKEPISIIPPSRMGEIIREGGFTGDTDLPEIFTTKSSEDVYIVKIVDRVKEEGLPFDDALEKFHEDDKNEYFLSGIYSHYVIVHYSDGTQEDIKSALKGGRASIADLDRFGIWYWTEPKKTTEETTATSYPVCSEPLYSTTTKPSGETTVPNGETSWPVCSHPLQSTTTKPLNPSTNATIVKIVDRTKEEYLVVADALEKIHEDEKNEYFLGGIYSHYVIVHYADGTQEDIKSALKSGRAKITDLDRFGIDYYTEPKETQKPVELDTFKGLEVYVWQMSDTSYYCGVLPGTNRLKTEEEILELMMNGVTIAEMREFLSVYGIRKESVFICPVRNPASSYWYEIDAEYCRKIEAMFWED